jgi:hypothetical protein
MVASPEISLLS